MKPVAVSPYKQATLTAHADAGRSTGERRHLGSASLILEGHHGQEDPASSLAQDTTTELQHTCMSPYKPNTHTNTHRHMHACSHTTHMHAYYSHRGHSKETGSCPNTCSRISLVALLSVTPTDSGHPSRYLPRSPALLGRKCPVPTVSSHGALPACPQ
jgi:hypothetical protein